VPDQEFDLEIERYDDEGALAAACPLCDFLAVSGLLCCTQHTASAAMNLLCEHLDVEHREGRVGHA
jgi:hypothetical protein